MVDNTISEGQAKTILAKYLSDQLLKALLQTNAVHIDGAWSIHFAGLPAEQYVVSKNGNLLTIMEGEYEIEINY